MSEPTYQELMEIAYGNYDIQCFETKRRAHVVDGKPYGVPIEIVHNTTKNQYVYVQPASGSILKLITQEEAKEIMDEGHKLSWRHCKDLGTTVWDGTTGEVKFYPYIPIKTA